MPKPVKPKEPKPSPPLGPKASPPEPTVIIPAPTLTCVVCGWPVEPSIACPVDGYLTGES